MTGLVAASLFLLIALLGLGVWVGLALMGVGAASLLVFRDLDVAAFLAGDIWRGLNTPELSALPLFILMGEILHRTRIASDMFTALSPWVRRVPGQLMHLNVIGCTLFAAVSGSSAATTATVGRITLGELEKRGYDRDLAIGSLCGAGTLGFLIPPSLILIVYGVLSSTSIIDLFIAGIVPGLMLALGYMLYIAVRAPRPVAADTDSDAVSWGAKLSGLGRLLPVVLLIILVIGSMYAGIAGPSEAATIGIAGALVIAAWQRVLTAATLVDALMGTVRTASMVGLIVAGAFFLSKTMAIFGLPQAAAALIAGLDLPPIGLILLLMLLYIVLGMVLDGLSIIVMTLPIALPLVVGAGFSPVWFGIFIVAVVEMSQITPPIGFNLFVVQGLTGEPISRVARASLPFFTIIAALVVAITLFPEIVTWPL